MHAKSVTFNQQTILLADCNGDGLQQINVSACPMAKRSTPERDTAFVTLHKFPNDHSVEQHEDSKARGKAPSRRDTRLIGHEELARKFVTFVKVRRNSP